jgi:medium-chain acyl-[acyl-carrier-protein] hydrolase
MSDATALNNWLICGKPPTQARLRLFCFPYAGGSASIYSGWSKSLPETVEVCAVQLPGRGSRLLEKAMSRMPELVEAVAQALRPQLDKPFAFFGHSMGATISFELARRLRQEGQAEPVHLFVSGSRAPQARNREPATYDLPEAEFMDELRRLKGTPAEVLEHPELMSLMMPVLRADFALIQTYAYKAAAPLSCPITAFGGLQDEAVSERQLQAWQAQTSAQFSLEMIEGDHFFIHSSQKRLLASLAKELTRIVKRLGR